MQIDSKVRWAVECLNSIDLCYLPGKSMKWLRNTELVFSLARKKTSSKCPMHGDGCGKRIKG
ncbi:MAG: hypothetical protein LM574_03275 [Archaeoglobus sp.]|nr:hypothetical protein [Archaeoglobus sp.]